MIRIYGTVLAGLLGLAFGSFLNVCLSRWPEGESVVQPRSHCRKCERTLTWWENVPLLSWLALRGRCRTCKEKISWRYPLVEAAVGILWAVVAWRSFEAFAPPVFAVGWCILMWILVGLAVTDAEHLWIPDVLTLPGIVLGFSSSFAGIKLVEVGLEFPKEPWVNLKDAWQVLSGILIAAGLILLIRWIYWLIRRREGLGLGDAKLMAMLAAWLGLPGALLSFAIGIFLGAAGALLVLLAPKPRRTEDAWSIKLPLGTFLCIGGIVSALWGQPIIAAYMRWAGF